MRKAAAILGAGLLTMLAGDGCQKKLGEGTHVLPDTGPSEFAEAERLATEAQKAQKAGNVAKAMELYNQSLEHSRTIWWVHNNIGLLFLQQGDRMHAVEEFKEAVDLETRDPRPEFNIGCVYADNAQPDRAMEYFRKSLEKDPHYLPSLRGVAKVGRSLAMADEESLQWIKDGLLIEKDPAWRKIFEEEKYRIDGVLQSTGKAGKF